MDDLATEAVSGVSTPTKRQRTAGLTVGHPAKRSHTGTSTSNLLSALGGPSFQHKSSLDEVSNDDGEDTVAASAQAAKTRGKGKGRMVYPPELPADVWTRIFDFYYEDLVNGWQTSATIRGGTIPLLISPDLTLTALPALYRHPHIGYNAIDQFVASLKKDTGPVKKRNLIRHLTIRPSPLIPSNQFAPFRAAKSTMEDAEDTRGIKHMVPYTVHTSFAHLMSLLPDLVSFTLKDTLVLHQADAQVLFSGLQYINPRKVRLEIGMCDLNDCPLGQDVQAALRGHTSRSTFVSEMANEVDRVRSWGVSRNDPVQEMLSSWKQALSLDVEFDLPSWWTETPNFVQLVQPTPLPPNPFFGPDLGQNLGGSLTGRTFWPYSASASSVRDYTSLVAPANPENDSSGDAQGSHAGSSSNSRHEQPLRLSDSSDWHRTININALLGSHTMNTATNCAPTSNSSSFAVPFTSLAAQLEALATNRSHHTRRSYGMDMSLVTKPDLVSAGHASLLSAIAHPPRISTAADLFTFTTTTNTNTNTNTGADDDTDTDMSGDGDHNPSEHNFPPGDNVNSEDAADDTNVDTVTAGLEHQVASGNSLHRSAPHPFIIPPNRISSLHSLFHGTGKKKGRDLAVPPSVIGGVHVTSSQGIHIHALAHYMRGLLLLLIKERWTPRLQALSFVAHDPLASLIVRAPELDFWTQTPVPHIRVHLPRGCGSLAVFKGPKEIARDQIRRRRAAAHHPPGQNRFVLFDAAALGPANAVQAQDPEDDIGIVGGDGSGGGLINEEVKLFEIEINNLSDMKDDVWIRCGDQLPPQLCRILAGKHDWRDVSLNHGCDTYSAPHSEYVPPASPDTSDFDSPTFSFISLSDDDDADVPDIDGIDENDPEEADR
ncbi:hypothetical protein IAU59_004438 [Kwoniella sp. CBS 9459]